MGLESRAFFVPWPSYRGLQRPRKGLQRATDNHAVVRNNEAGAKAHQLGVSLTKQARDSGLLWGLPSEYNPLQ